MSNAVKPAMAKLPKVYDLDAAIAETTHPPFTFVFGGREWSIPDLNDLNVWPLVEKIEQGDLIAMMTVLETAFGDAWDDFHALPMPQWAMTSLFQRYQKHSGMEPGESPASINSSPSTAGR